MSAPGEVATLIIVGHAIYTTTSAATVAFLLWFASLGRRLNDDVRMAGGDE